MQVEHTTWLSLASSLCVFVVSVPCAENFLYLHSSPGPALQATNRSRCPKAHPLAFRCTFSPSLLDHA